MSVGQRMASISFLRNARRFMTACSDRAIFFGRDFSRAVHSSSIERFSALLRVLWPNSSFTAMGVNGAGPMIFTSIARKL
jgi:hypothetical protein